MEFTAGTPLRVGVLKTTVNAEDTMRALLIRTGFGGLLY